jgi:hypothetical protein
MATERPTFPQPPSEPATTRTPRSFTRLAAAWWALVVGLLNLIVLLIFVAQNTNPATLHLPVTRTRQVTASSAHVSQAIPTSVLWRRLELLGDVEHLRWLTPVKRYQHKTGEKRLLAAVVCCAAATCVIRGIGDPQSCFDAADSGWC